MRRSPWIRVDSKFNNKNPSERKAEEDLRQRTQREVKEGKSPLR